MPRHPQLMDNRVVQALAETSSQVHDLATPEGRAQATDYLADLVQRASGRSCTGCTLCCKLPAIPALEKPAAKWCTHCDPKSGCTIYAERPTVCRDFICAWRAGYGPDAMKPSSVRLYVTMNPIDDEGRHLWQFQADVSRPEALREPVVAEFLKRVRSTGDPVVLQVGAQQASS